MPATKRQTGYLVKIEAFVPAELSDIKAFAELQQHVNKACAEVDLSAKATITPTRR